MKIIHVFHRLILSTSNMAEGAKHDVHWCKETALFYDYSFKEGNQLQYTTI